ncbi:cytochrome-c peroxidase [Fibrella sp. WM1]|uniref:cytochrome-c peroxidase n=1 Tax=Fibrella musci TaxID=3242485 RepID=UPI00352268EB
MKLLLPFFGMAALFVVLFGFIEARSAQEQTTQRAKAQVVAQLEALQTFVDSTFSPLAQRTQSTDALQAAFQTFRLRYKRIEPVTAYYMPHTNRQLNGPPLPEIEVEEHKTFEPGGLQVIETMLYPAFDTTNRAELLREVAKFRRELNSARYLWYATALTDNHLFDLMRLGTFRLAAMGISGFDTPACRSAIPEAAETLRSIQRLLSLYKRNNDAYRQLNRRLDGAIAFCQRQPDFNQFDRATFLRTYLNSISAGLLDYQRSLGIAPLTDQRPLNAAAPTLFAPNAFNAAFYAPTADQRPTPARAALGRRLFSDPILSGNGQRSCATCHQPERAFTDGLTRAFPIGIVDTPLRNTPTLLNAALQAGYFYDLRTNTLESQAFDVVHNRAEMAGSLDEAARRLRVSPAYMAAFKKAFPADQRPISADQIQNALASYERSLVSLNSRFDRYMRGQTAALNADEVRGFNIFMGKAQCGTCHFMPLFNGTVPPEFTTIESEVIGVPARADNRQLDTDAGRYVHTKLDPLQYAFKTPTLRHIAQTAPYMHNGVYRTLDEVVDFYDKGGGVGLGFSLPNQTLSANKLDLTAAEKKALVSFLKAL